MEKKTGMIIKTRVINNYTAGIDERILFYIFVRFN